MISYGDDISFGRIINLPKRNIGEKRMTFLKDYAEEQDCTLYQALLHNQEDSLFKKTGAGEFIGLVEKYRQIYEDMKISELLTDILNDSGYEALLRTDGEQERLDNLAELKQSVFEYENSAGEECALTDYLEKISLFTNLDQKESADAVQMMTIHTAKGLEFPYVFVCGLNEGIFPSKHIDNSDKMEEERRLAYVAFTRAENALYISDAEGIHYDGSYRYPSRFIFNIEKTYINYVVELEGRLTSDARMYIEQNEKKLELNGKNLITGDLVMHHVFGKGRIVDINRENSTYIIQFESMETTRNISFKIMLEHIGHEE
jgi:DNA helicase-2/ATP-dependent DNA helicase PcrA